MINSKIKVSIIVPVYNAGIHLEKCLDTLINQTLKEIEIIIVLDCPTDGSDKVSKMYAEKDNRIIIVENTDNLHIGKSRNKGFALATGEYIGFSDHDDYRDLNMYEELYKNAVSENSDIVLSGYGTDTHSKIEEKLYPKSFDMTFYRKLLIGGYNVEEEWKYFIQNGGMWNKIYKKELLFNNNIQFVDNRETTYEDLLFLIETSIHSKKISIVNKVFYYHLEEIGNASSQFFFNDINLVISFLIKLKEVLINSNLFKYYEMDFNKAIANMVIISITNELKSNNKIIHKLQTINKLKKITFIREAFKVLSTKDIIYQPTTILSKSYRFLIFKFFE